MKRGISSLALVLVTILSIIPLISAYSFGGSSPFDYFDNEWIIFSILLLVLFAGIFSFFKERMGSSGAAVVLSLGLSVLISIPIMQRGLLDSFLNESVVDILILVALIAFLVILFFKFSFKRSAVGVRTFSWTRFFFFLLIGAFLISLIKDYLPDVIMGGTIGNMINNIESLGWNLVIILIVIFIAYGIFKWFGRRRGGN